MNKSKIKSRSTSEELSWWLKPLAEPLAQQATDVAGLSSAEAGSRLAKFGPNLFRDHQERPLFLQFLARFKNPLVILLLVTSAISAFTGEITNFVIISVMVLFSVTLDFIQEHRAGKAAESLRHSVSMRARVIRDGKAIEVPVTEVVPGDLSEVPIPLDEVDAEELRKPRILDMKFIRNFMLVIGPISSAFDFLTFYVMLSVLKANETLFQTGWFVESLSTQVLVIFIIRTRGNPFKSRAHPILVATSLTVMAIGALLPFTPWGLYFGFVAPPAQFYAILAGMVVTYLVIVEVAKRGFYKWHRISGKA